MRYPDPSQQIAILSREREEFYPYHETEGTAVFVMLRVGPRQRQVGLYHETEGTAVFVMPGPFPFIPGSSIDYFVTAPSGGWLGSAAVPKGVFLIDYFVTGHPRSTSLIAGEWHDITAFARKRLLDIGNQHLAREANKLLNKISGAVDRLGYKNLPDIEAFESQDGSLLLEWFFSDCRIGFSVEPEPEESGWYLVCGTPGRGVFESGYLDEIKDFEALIARLLNRSIMTAK